MRFEVPSKNDMSDFSRQLSRAGVMNKKIEEVTREVSHYLVIGDKYGKLLKNAKGIGIIEEGLQNIKRAYDSIIGPLQVGDEIPTEEFLKDSEGGLTLLTALVEAGAVEEADGRLRITSKPSLENLRIELRFPLVELGDYLDSLEERFKVKMVSEISMVKSYYVEVLEVDRELIEVALEIGKDYATEESYVDAMFMGIARSVLADTILQLAEEYRRKDELINKLLGMEPLTVEGENERVQIHFDEESIESFLKELQTLGYLKVKGNRIWV